MKVYVLFYFSFDSTLPVFHGAFINPLRARREYEKLKSGGKIDPEYAYCVGLQITLGKG
jgi:hypothetical protein